MMGPMRAVGFSVRQSAVNLGRAPSTVSRELHRGTDNSGGYASYWAQLKARLAPTLAPYRETQFKERP